jgi:hypothetical protein
MPNCRLNDASVLQQSSLHLISDDTGSPRLQEVVVAERITSEDTIIEL